MHPVRVLGAVAAAAVLAFGTASTPATGQSATSSRPAATHRAASWKVSWPLPPLHRNLDRGSTRLASVSCVNRTFCMVAGGWDSHHFPWGSLSVAEIYDPTAGTWTRTDLAVKGNDVRQVSCASTRFCVAVGYGLVAEWDGSTWQREQAPQGFEDQTLSVACRRDDRCVVPVGTGRILWYSKGGSWSEQLGPHATDIGDVTCRAPRFCMAEAAGNRDRPAFVSWDGTSWNRRYVGHPSRGKEVDVNGLSCASRTSCVAVGAWDRQRKDYTYARGNLLWTWDGHSWTRRRIPSRYRDDTGRVIHWTPQAIACTATRRCIVVGDNMTVGRWHGQVLTLTRVGGRRLLRTHGGLLAVDCVPGRRRCMASGTSGGPKAVAAVGRS